MSAYSNSHVIKGHAFVPQYAACPSARRPAHHLRNFLGKKVMLPALK